MPFPSQRQAMLPTNIELIPNPKGTASGFLIADAGREFMFMPGVPSEAEAMTESFIIPRLKEKSGFKQVILSKSLRVFGLWESAVQERLDGQIEEGPGLCLAYLPHFPEVRLKITGMGEDEDKVQQDVARAAAIIQERLSEYIYSAHDEPLELVAGQLLKKKKATIALAESCTGGLISNRITNISGSSEYLLMAVVAYSNRAKVDLLKIPQAVLDEHGAVSEPTARLMAKNVRELANATYGISVTGIAGPTGGSEEKPVGTVFIGIASAEGESVTQHRCYGGREQIKLMSSHLALNNLRKYILQQ
jgi:nicotinamide-nucleotide amidase